MLFIFLQDLIKENELLSERIIKEFHYLLLKGTEYEREARKYRNIPVMIGGAEHIPPQPYLLQSKMENLIANYNQQIVHCHLMEKLNLIAKLHADFVYIHPFVDGNGRTGRLLMNLELMKNGFPIAIISADEHVDYYEALAKADNGEYDEIT